MIPVKGALVSESCHQSLRYLVNHAEGRLTGCGNMELVNWGLSIEESTLVEEVVTGIAIVGDNGLDLGVSERSKLDIKRGISSLEADCSAVGCSSQCKELG